ncbi:hypothetical protein EDD17DRAFT_862318 [Pisolithus thermaeus]|nr:hypothetical protein EDD17DRAFT_862318 [Pisolithus thermaeus]
MVQLQEAYPNAAAHEMVSLLFHEQEMSVSQSIVCKYFTVYEPHLVKFWKAGCLQQHRFWAAGVNNIGQLTNMTNGPDLDLLFIQALSLSLVKPCGCIFGTLIAIPNLF